MELKKLHGFNRESRGVPAASKPAKRVVSVGRFKNRKTGLPVSGKDPAKMTKYERERLEKRGLL